MTKLIPVIISLLLLFSIVGCTNNQDKQLLNAVKEPTLITPSPQLKCPTHNDVRVSIKDSTKLSDDAISILHNAKAADPTVSTEALKAQIASWKCEKGSWDTKNNMLIANCDLLLGATGTTVYPEIPLALKKLDQAGEWLEKSMEAVTRGKIQIANAYIKGARAATGYANKILEGKVKAESPGAVMKVPNYIKKPDKQ